MPIGCLRYRRGDESLQAVTSRLLTSYEPLTDQLRAAY